MTIDELLKKASPRPWGYTYDGSSDWSIGPKDDPQVNPVMNIWTKDDDKAHANAQIICIAINKFERMREALKIIMSRAGLPDAKEACRLIIQDAKEALKEIEK